MMVARRLPAADAPSRVFIDGLPCKVNMGRFQPPINNT
jgi:hypothetical protein